MEAGIPFFEATNIKYFSICRLSPDYILYDFMRKLYKIYLDEDTVSGLH